MRKTTNIRRLFNICLVVLMWMLSTALFTAVTVPAHVSGSASAEQLRQTAQMHRAGLLALTCVIWAAVFACVAIPALVKRLDK